MTSASREVIVVSNGHGEDMIAVRILDRLAPQLPHDIRLTAWPMVGEGSAYTARGVSVEGPRNLLPSEGFGTIDMRLLLRDLRAGFIGTQVRQLRHARRLRGRAQLMIGVGDLVPLIVAALSATPMAFVACAKSAYYGGRHARAGAHTPLERALMRRWCCDVFPRDRLTARGLAARGIVAHDLGNPMMDGLDAPACPALAPRGGTLVAVLPGSRRDAAENARFVLDAAHAFDRAHPADSPPVALAFACTQAIDIALLARAAAADGWREEPAPAATPAGTRALTAPGGTRVWLVPDAFATVLRTSSLAVGLAGTANEQAIGLGLPLITAPGAASQGKAYLRMKMAYFGDAALAVPRNPGAIAAALAALLEDAPRRARMGAAGRERMGEPGASEAIAQAILARLI